jgi:hypothetical protein
MNNHEEILNCFPNTPALRMIRSDGDGLLISSKARKIKCPIFVKQLVNGRLQVFISTDKELKTSLEYQIQFKIDSGLYFFGKSLHFTQETVHFNELGTHIYSGFIDELTYQNKKRCYAKCQCIFLLTNHHRNFQNFSIKVENWVVKTRLISPSRILKQAEINDMKSSYFLNTISTEISIENVKKGEVKGVEKLIATLSLLMSFANRNFHFIASYERLSRRKKLLYYQLREPTFHKPGWPRQLIPPRCLGGFLEVALDNFQKRNLEFELRMAIDHFLQALTLRSAWSISLGIFTAIETINSAFYNKNSNTNKKSNYYWVPDDKAFEENKDLYVEILNVLTNHFSEFSNLDKSEKDSLRAQLRWINRRSYKTQLMYLLNCLHVKFDKNDIRAVINIRNRIIHSGVPVFSEANEYSKATEKAWNYVQKAAKLFENIVLAILGYEGQYEPFNRKC